MSNYEYTQCSEGESQYNDWDFQKEKIVPAIYIPARLGIDKGNPYIEALPNPRNENNIIRAYSHAIPSYSYDKIKSMSTYDKMLQIGTLRTVRFPLPFHKSLEFEFYNALLTSYRSREQIKSKNDTSQYMTKDKRVSTNTILTGDSAAATNAGFSLIGYSGCGKSSSINKLVSHYPQVIMHDDGNGGYYPQIVYLVVNCIANSNFSALYQGIGDAIDKALGNIQPIYSKEIARTTGLGKKAEKIREYVEKFAIGIIIFDEIQLIDFEHTKENTFESLLTLANRTKVAIAVVGTEDARSKMFKELRTSRRVGRVINSNAYCENKEYFKHLVRQLFNYQWFETPVEVTDEIIDALYSVTKGIVDQLVGVYSCMNYDYLSKKAKPKIDAKYIKYIAKTYYPGMQKVLADINPDEDSVQWDSIKNSAQEKVNLIIDKVKQEKEIENLIDSADIMNQERIQFSNVKANIMAIFDEYSDDEIEEAFNKVMNRKNNSEKDERQISKCVIEQLQKKPKRYNKKVKLATPDIEHMRDFLGVGEGA